MVKHSLRRLLDKYPYFLDKRNVSNLFKVTKVNNSLFQDLYNSLFHTYESFHIGKRLLVWREQTLPYIYRNHFCCSFPNIRRVIICKDDTVIYETDFLEEANKTDFEYVYESEYYKSNMLPVQIYKCATCTEETIYYGEIPVECNVCGGHTYTTVHAYKCSECGEIYYTNPNSNGEVEITCTTGCTDNTFIEVYAYKCLGNDYTITKDDNGNIYLTTDCGEIYIDIIPPVCTNCGNTGHTNKNELYPYEDIILINDNSEIYDEEINNITVTDTRPHFYFEQDTHDNIYVKGDNLNSNLHYYIAEYYSADEIVFMNTVNSEEVFDCDRKYRIYSSPTDIFTELYEGVTLEEIEQNEIEVTFIGDLLFPNGELYEEEINLPIHLYNRLIVDIPTYHETEDTTTPLTLPVINDNLFKFYVETWDEYWEIKGYPENDIYQNDIFDHDYSLDELGELNNIPRKEYITISNDDLYPLTEPPYNKSLTEDDYHYMKRMIEYNLRQWCTLNLYKYNDGVEDGDYNNYIQFLNSIGITENDYQTYTQNTRLFRENYNPVTLELWKKYSINSRLVNREHKLLKLFDLRKHNTHYLPYKTDEDNKPLMDYNGNYIYKDEWEVVTDLSETWIPKEWEHQDRFCDGSQLYGEYLYVTASTLRPIPYENVDLKYRLLNSLAEPVTDDYYINLYYFREDESQLKRLGSRDISNGESTISFKAISMTTPTTIRSVAYKTDGTFIDCCDVTFNPQNCTNADIYVDANSIEETENGTKDYPFKNLQDALNRVNQNFSVIALKSNITITSPLFVPNTCKILGCRNSNDNVPIITNTQDNHFFKLIGGKNCSITLVDLRLKYGQTNSYIGISSWLNKNTGIDNYSSVITRGGLCILTAELDKEEYYPIDTVKITGTITDNKGTLLTNQNVDLYFDNTYITTLTSDNDGEIEYSLNINKENTGIYDIRLTLKSDVFFPTTKIIKVNCTKQPVFYDILLGEQVTINCENHSDYEGETLTVIIDGIETQDTVTVVDGAFDYDYTPTWGRHTIQFVDENGNVVDVAIIETTITMSLLEDTTFIKNIDIASDSTISYETITVDNNTTVGDLDGIISNMEVNNVFLDISTFNVDESRVDETTILASECLELAECLTVLEYDSSSTIISYSRLGEFWELE